MKYKDWVKSYLEVGAFPIFQNTTWDATKYDVLINVSDEYYPELLQQITDVNPNIQTHWFPMNEAKKDVGLNSIFGAIVTMYHAEIKQKKVYLHCHAGVNRSRCVEAAYHFYRTGNQLERDTNGYINRLVAMCHRGYLPPKAEMEKFLSLVAKKTKVNAQLGGVLDECKISTINNF
jgi:hypothetical protein